VAVNFEDLDAIPRDERVTRALNDLWHGRAVEPELKQELWLRARGSPAVRHGAEPGARSRLLIPGR
jgi:hypothetical protein